MGIANHIPLLDAQEPLVLEGIYVSLACMTQHQATIYLVSYMRNFIVEERRITAVNYVRLYAPTQSWFDSTDGVILF